MTLQDSPACQEEDETQNYHACIDHSHADTGSSSSTTSIRIPMILVLVERIQRWFHESAWPGMGLFGESYLLFSIGTLKPVWELLYPDCVVNHTTCSRALTSSLSYSVVLGVIAGMITIGYLANHIGRRAGSILTASLMATGSIGMVVTSMIFSQHPQTLFQSMVLLLAIFGVGVGGEYPLSAASASEKCMTTSSSSSSSSTINNKGQQVLLVFTMQGMGIFVNSISQSILLIIFQQFGHHIILNDENNDLLYQYDPAKLFYIWRIIYAIGAAFLIYVLISRVIHLKESAAWAKDREEQSRSHEQPPTEEVPKSSSTYATTTITDSSKKAAWFLLLRHYGIRLLGTSSAWLLWDVSFYD